MHLVRSLSTCAQFALMSAVLAAAGAGGTEEPGGAGAAVRDLLLQHRDDLGLDAWADLQVRDVQAEPSGVTHVRLQQHYRGLKVWGAQAITHRDAQGPVQPMTDALVRGIQLETTPNLTAAEALGLANTATAPVGAYSRPPTAELVVYPEAAQQASLLGPGTGNAEDFEVRVLRHHLAWHVHLELENGPVETRHDDFLVDAHTGAVLKRWSTLLTLKGGTAVTTVGKSQYNGEVQLGSLKMPCGFILSDPTRNNIATRNLSGQTWGKGELYVNPDPAWGDGENYQETRGSKSTNGQTAAVDAHYGLQSTWDFYKAILGRNGIDGKGRTPYNLVHYASQYDNAFWSDDCFCMTFGDGSVLKTLTTVDVVGHEVSHGLCSATANLDYRGESGGLNESNSDIFGVMISFYTKGAQAQGDRIPETGGQWTIGSQLVTRANPRPLRFMMKPSLDGFSPDAWSPQLENLDVHEASGPMNRAFYFLSQGASKKKKDDTYSKYLPKGMAGIGNDKALRIWWKTLSTQLTPTSRYVDARNGAVRAAQSLYGKAAPEVTAVRYAFKAINVGECAPKPPKPPKRRPPQGWGWGGDGDWASSLTLED